MVQERCNPEVDSVHLKAHCCTPLKNHRQMLASLGVVSFQIIFQRQDGISFKAYLTGYCCPVLLYCHILGFTQCMQHFLSVDSVNHMITGVKCYNYILLVLFWRISTEE